MKKILLIALLGAFLMGCSNNKFKEEREQLWKDITELREQKQSFTTQIDTLRNVLSETRKEYASTESEHRIQGLKTERQKIEKNIVGLKRQNAELQEEKDALKLKLSEMYDRKATYDYIHILKIRIHQTTYTLSISEHIKNKINDIELEIPVDKEFYDANAAGKEISGSWKMGSILLNGDMSKLKIIVTEKRKVRRQTKYE